MPLVLDQTLTACQEIVFILQTSIIMMVIITFTTHSSFHVLWKLIQLCQVSLDVDIHSILKCNCSTIFGEFRSWRFNKNRLYCKCFRRFFWKNYLFLRTPWIGTYKGHQREGFFLDFWSYLLRFSKTFYFRSLPYNEIALLES